MYFHVPRRSDVLGARHEQLPFIFPTVQVEPFLTLLHSCSIPDEIAIVRITTSVEIVLPVILTDANTSNCMRDTSKNWVPRVTRPEHTTVFQLLKPRRTHLVSYCLLVGNEGR